ncbi:MAG: cytochrome C oxidase subunit IV family protein [Saprospiraceae bacterium]
MADHLTYEESKKAVMRGLWLLAVVTLVEVFISLLGKGHIISGIEDYKAVIYGAGLLIIVLSVYKAYFIIFDFMHMKYEVKGLAMSVLLPVLLLVWAIIAFMQEGSAWGERRELIKDKNEAPIEEVGMMEQNVIPADTKELG